MSNHTVRFWLLLAGKLGPPIFAATLVGTLLSGEMTLFHAALLGVGMALIYPHHRTIEHE